MTAPLVTVFIPSYKHAQYIEQAIRSVWAQTYRPLELIINDDGSPDDSVVIAKALQKHSPIPMTVHQSEHLGISASMSFGLSQAKGVYWSGLASDDFYEPEKVETQVRALEADPGAVMAHSEYFYVDPEGRRFGNSADSEMPPPAKGEALRDLLLLRSDIRGVTLTMRRQAMLDAGGYDASIRNEDWQLNLRMAARGRVVHHLKPLVSRRMHGQNLTFQGPKRPLPFTLKDDVLIDILKEVMPPDLDLESVAALHAAMSLRNLASLGVWSRLLEGTRVSIEAFPRKTGLITSQITRGLLSYGWVNGPKRVIPAQVASALRDLKIRLKKKQEDDRWSKLS